MSDKDLLEAAAKAAGYMPNQNWIWLTDRGCFTYRVEGKHVFWNPLTDDGDALRLAVQLNLQPRQGVNLVSVLRHDGGWHDENYRDHNNDPYAATRRAIVRAAAEIGRGMP